MARRMAHGIGDPIRQCAEHLKLLAGGNLAAEMLDITSEDEIGILADATNSITQNMKLIIKDMEYMVREMGEGDFTVTSQAEEKYVGDFAILKSSVNKLNDKLSKTIHYI